MGSKNVHYGDDINKIFLMKLKQEELQVRSQAIKEQFMDLNFKIELKIDHMDPAVLK